MATSRRRSKKFQGEFTDLWPEHFEDTNSIPPVAYLRYQATLLGRKTQHLVEAEVESNALRENAGTIYHNFYIVAPLLGDYRYKLFYVAHGFDSYEKRVVLADEQERIEFSNIGEFLDGLSVFLKSEKVRRLITGLVNQSVQID